MSLQETLNSPDCIVHVEYDIYNPPPPPSDKWTRFVCISDTHSHAFPVPDGDVLLHSGDLTNTGTVKDFEKTMDWICSLKHGLKIIIAGNHDLTLHTGWYDNNWSRWHKKPKPLEPIMQLLTGPRAKGANVVYLQDAQYQFQAKEGGRTWSVYGSPWSPEFWNWAFNYNPGEEAENIVSKFPKTDILLTHGPPHRVFDITTGQDYPGCQSLASNLPKLRPRIHLFGHIHEAHGAYIHEWPREEGQLGRCPKVQNSSYGGVEDPAKLEQSELNPSGNGDDRTDRTAFVNAANWPMGLRAHKYSNKGFGGSGFLPVIVDLLD
ncbi:Metallo-dependent phosphatase [Dendrothele bispora CBS 962.96]|uniref:Metallo-dependent phosphatase n=1 Tax=Dendrothele bispora (strain CBS 962.96) TaxID=1314807 RepID=A0A4S8L453_DENBC|nr:Metallo-dependent phosphatase [Dendrothele bispora CBS 962.96]